MARKSRRTIPDSNNGMMKMCEVREELSKLLGYRVTVAKYQYYRKLGIAPPAPEGNKYGRYMSMEDVYKIHMNLMEIKSSEPPNTKKRFRWRIPGYFRKFELCREIEKRVGIDMPQWRINSLINQGIIPEGAVRPYKMHGGISLRNAWTDQQVEEIIASLSAHYELTDVL
jgi:hypothetical protein